MVIFVLVWFFWISVLSKPVWLSGQVRALHVTTQETEQQFPIEPHSNHAGEMKIEGLVSGGEQTHMKENSNKLIIWEKKPY